MGPFRTDFPNNHTLIRRLILVGGLEHDLFFPYIGMNVIIPTDFHIFQRGSNHQPDNNKQWILGLLHVITLFSDKPIFYIMILCYPKYITYILSHG
jgi:hypothetical protein